MSKRPQKVLVVDDSEFVREFVRTALEEAGYKVVPLDSPAGFSRAMMLEKPDLVLMDVGMPALSGDKLVEIARRGDLHRCPILLFSDRPEAELATLVKDCGANGYIRKTSDPDLLVLKVRRFMTG